MRYLFSNVNVLEVLFEIYLYSFFLLLTVFILKSQRKNIYMILSWQLLLSCSCISAMQLDLALHNILCKIITKSVQVHPCFVNAIWDVISGTFCKQAASTVSHASWLMTPQAISQSNDNEVNILMSLHYCFILSLLSNTEQIPTLITSAKELV